MAILRLRCIKLVSVRWPATSFIISFSIKVLYHTFGECPLDGVANLYPIVRLVV